MHLHLSGHTCVFCRAWRQAKSGFPRFSALLFILALILFLMATVGFGEERKEERKFHLGIYSGGQMPLSARVPAKVVPMLRVQVQSPLGGGDLAPALHVLLDIGGLPGESVGENPSTFRSAEFAVGLSQPLAPAHFFGELYAEGGFATRMAGDASPRISAPRWVMGGLLFQTQNRRAKLKLGIGADQRISAAASVAALRWEPAVVVGGHVVIRTIDAKIRGRSLARIQVAIVGDASLHISAYPQRTGQAQVQDTYRLGIAIGGSS